MKHNLIYFYLIAPLLFLSATACASDDVPTIAPVVTYVNPDGSEVTEQSHSGSAPIVANLDAGVADAEGWNAEYEWRIILEGQTDPWITRYGEQNQVTFTQRGKHNIYCYAIFRRGTEVVEYTHDYWAEHKSEIPTCTVLESKLEMPNAFSPNGDQINDIYRPKSGYQSIIEFHATIYNRWGQKLFEWDNPAEGWDGTYHGSPVADGVYYVLVKALGSDGHKYEFKRDVNLLRGFTERENSSQ